VLQHTTQRGEGSPDKTSASSNADTENVLTVMLKHGSKKGQRRNMF